MNEDHPIYKAIDRGGGQTCDIPGVLRELDAAGYAIVPKAAFAAQQDGARPDFGIHTVYHEDVPLTCRYVAPGVTFHDLARAFHEAKAEAKPGDEMAGNPAKWPDNRGISAVMNKLLDAIYGPAAPEQDVLTK